MATHGSGCDLSERTPYTEFAHIKPEAWQTLSVTPGNSFRLPRPVLIVSSCPCALFAERLPIAVTATELLRKSD